MKHTARVVSVMLLGANLLLACGPAADDDPTAACDGQYDCTGGGTSTTTTLARRDGHCYAGAIVLNPDGSTNAQSSVRWSGTAASFSICVGSDCLTCNRRGGTSSSSGGGRCVGYTGTCTDRGAGCESLPGCYLERRYVGGYYSDYCTGSPAQCGDRGTRSECEYLTGCRWEP